MFNYKTSCRNRARLQQFVQYIVLYEADCSYLGYTTRGMYERTLLLKNIYVYSTGQFIDDHMWVKLSDIVNLAAVSYKLARDVHIVFSGIAYPYYSENHKRVMAKKYGIRNICIQDITHGEMAA